MSDSIIITVDGTQYDVTNDLIANSLKIDNSIFNELEPTTNKASFQLNRSSTVIPHILVTTTDVVIEIYQDSAYVFKGYLTDNFSYQVTNRGQQSVQISVEDPGIKLLKKTWISENTLYTYYNNLAVCDLTTTSNSIIHKIAALAGATVSSLIPAISSTLSLNIQDSDNKTYWDVLKDITYEYGYVFYFENDGELNLYAVAKSAITPVATFSSTTNLIAEDDNSGISLQKKIQQYKQINLTWKEWKTYSNIYVFNDTTNGSDTYPCNIELAAGAYYPTGADANTFIYSDYDSANGKKIVNVNSATLEYAVDAGITVEYENLGTKAKFRFHNTTGVTADIRKIKVLASSVILEENENTIKAGSNKPPILKYTAKYIHDSTTAQNFVNTLKDHYSYSNCEYTFKSKTNIAVGNIVTLHDTLWNTINEPVLITSSSQNGKKLITYTAIGIDTFDLFAPTTRGTTVSSGSTRLISIPEITTPTITIGTTPITLGDTVTTITGVDVTAGDVTIAGSLTVNGTTTTLNTTTLTVDDKNIELGSVTTPTDTTANGGGITLKGATDKTIIWDSINSNWTLNQSVNIPTGNVYKINNTSILSTTTLGSSVVNSSLASLGTITTGVWNATAITDTYLAIISTAGKVANSATTATSANTVSTIVARDTSGSFSVSNIYMYGASNPYLRIDKTNATARTWYLQAYQNSFGIGTEWSKSLIVDYLGNTGNSTYISGSLGTGWRVDYNNSISNKSYLEVDNIRVRDTLYASVFQKDIIKVSNGQLLVSDGGIVADIDASYIYFDPDKSATFSSGQRLEVKDINISTGIGITAVYFNITSSYTIVSGTSTVLDGTYKYSYTLVSGTYTDIKTGMTAARVSGGLVLLDSVTSNSPFIDVINNYTTYARLGNLSGITSTTWGALTGYGLWSNNVYLEGYIKANSGSFNGTITAGSGSTIGGWTSTTSALTGGNARLYSSGILSLGVADGYNTTNSIYLDGANSRFSLGTKLTYTGDTLTINGNGTFSGALNAATGTFAGSLSAATGSFTGSITTSSATITGGSLSVGSNFSVNSSGVLTASSATISGAITATSGSFTGAVYASSGSFNGSITSSSATITGGSLSVGSNFSVNSSGVLNASSATISGAITATSGSSISASYISGLGALATLNSLTAAQVGALASSWTPSWGQVSGLPQNISDIAGLGTTIISGGLIKAEALDVAAIAAKTAFINALVTQTLTLNGGSISLTNGSYISGYVISTSSPFKEITAGTGGTSFMVKRPMTCLLRNSSQYTTYLYLHYNNANYLMGSATGSAPMAVTLGPGNYQVITESGTGYLDVIGVFGEVEATQAAQGRSIV